MPHISFARTLVTGVSRQLNNEEHWTLFYFEQHASTCHACYNPAAVQKAGRQLCEEGRKLACTVAALLFRLCEDGHVYAEEEEQFVRVEMPAKYEHVSGLFKAVQASRSNILVRPRSMDAHYPVRPRIPAAHQYSVGGHQPQHVAVGSAHDYEFDYNYPRAAQYTLATSPRRTSPRPSAGQFPSRSSRDSQGSGSSARWSRGSLFDDDHRLEQMREAREQQLRYKQFRQSATWG
jgi:hypothetical protein